MRLKSLTMKGFKSFPDRTKLDFGPGVSVIVGPNGSGKSNVTDAVLWAMGEQSPLAVRGQSMQDVIFGGGRGVQARSAAEVEIVLDNADGRVEVPLSEIAISRRLDRTGESGYRLNGARCRLTDVIEVLSDTGLGKETHSVVSQGRIEAIVTSKPRDRRLLIEEAAGLGKHRKRRRRAQLKLERTQENLDRALDVEREARSRLRPLKRQAEAAKLHERLERQLYEARFALAREAVRAGALELGEAESTVARARAAREAIETELQAIVQRRAAAEAALAERTERHDALARRAYEIRSARERIQLRGEQAQASAAVLRERIARAEAELRELTGDAGQEQAHEPESAAEPRLAALEAQLAELDRERERELERELEGLREQRDSLAEQVVVLEQAAASARELRGQADAETERARAELRQAEAGAQAARRDAAAVGAELAAVNQFLANHARFATAGPGDVTALSEILTVADGYELALAAALGGRLDAALVRDLPAADELLDRAGPDGAGALLAGAPTAAASRASDPPAPGATRLSELVKGPAPALSVARRLLADAWVVQRLADVRPDFEGIAATRNGRVLFGAWGEVRQAHAGGAERVLAKRNERERLIAASEAAARAEQAAGLALQNASQDVRAAETRGLEVERQLRERERELAETRESERQAGWLIEQRRSAPDQGPLAVRRAKLVGELAAERRQAERLAAERARREQRIALLRARQTADAALVPLAPRLAAVLAAVGESADGLLSDLSAELDRDRAAGEDLAGELRQCAHGEAAVQARLREVGEQVTRVEVSAQRSRDQLAEAQQELNEIADQLGKTPAPAGDGVSGEDYGAPAGDGASGEDYGAPAGDGASGEDDGAPAGEGVSGEDDGAPAGDGASTGQENKVEPLSAEEADALRARVQRLVRRREQLGPVNPLAKQEYAEAIAHVEELETRRADLETALRELKGVIKETDRQIAQTFEETFAAAARNFEELAADVFPGGSGRLRLVRDEHLPRGVLGGQAIADGAGSAGGAGGEGGAGGSGGPGSAGGEGPGAVGAAEAADAAEAAADAEAAREAARQQGLEDDAMGVEIEITPTGKATKRLSLLSGGEKSMTALAFLFAVFLAKPCPFYILDEVEAALDDLNLDRFLTLLRRYSDRAQFIVITHQKRTMEAADWLFGVSMAGNGVSKIISRRLPPEALAGGAASGDVEPARGAADGVTKPADAEGARDGEAAYVDAEIPDPAIAADAEPAEDASVAQVA